MRAGGKLRMTAALVNKQQIWTRPRGMRVRMKEASLSRAELTVDARHLARRQTPCMLLSTSHSRSKSPHLRCETKLGFVATSGAGLGETCWPNCSNSVTLNYENVFFLNCKPLSETHRGVTSLLATNERASGVTHTRGENPLRGS